MDRIVVLLNKRSAYVSQKYYFLTLVHGIPEGMLQRASLRVHPKSRFTYMMQLRRLYILSPNVNQSLVFVKWPLEIFITCGV